MYDFLPLTKPSATIAMPTSRAKTAVKRFSTITTPFALREIQTSQKEYALKDVCVFVFVTCIDVCEYITHAYIGLDFLHKRNIS